MSATPLHSGILLLPTIIIEAILGIATGIIMHRTGRYQELIWVGVILQTIGNGLFIHFGARSSITEIVIFQLIAGIGAGMLFTPPLIAIQALVSQDETATAISTLGFIRNLATACSVVIGGVVFQNGMDLQTTNLSHAGLSTEIVHDFSGGAAAANILVVNTIKDPLQQFAIKGAFAWSLRNMWIMYTCVSGIGIVASVFITKNFLSREHTETRTGLKKDQAPAPSPTA